MIMLYTGTPGSGKSLHMAKDIYYYLNCRKNHLVICNFDIDVSKVKYESRFVYLDNASLKTPEIVKSLCFDFNHEYGLKEGNIVLFLDEAQILFNARTWNEAGRLEWLSFFSQHRKYGVNCFIVCQFDGMIDKQIRALIEYQTVHRKVTNFGLFGLLAKLFAFGKDCFVAVESWYLMKERTGIEFFVNRKKYYSLYDTFNTFNSV